MNKPLSVNIKDTKKKLIDICNESGLSPSILDLIVQGIYSEIRYLAEKQTLEDEESFKEFLNNKNDNSNKITKIAKKSEIIN